MCHDLQLTYLMILEKHFIFDLAEFEELTILLEGMSNGYNAELGLALLYSFDKTLVWYDVTGWPTQLDACAPI